MGKWNAGKSFKVVLPSTMIQSRVARRSSLSRKESVSIVVEKQGNSGVEEEEKEAAEEEGARREEAEEVATEAQVCALAAGLKFASRFHIAASTPHNKG